MPSYKNARSTAVARINDRKHTGPMSHHTGLDVPASRLDLATALEDLRKSEEAGKLKQYRTERRKRNKTQRASRRQNRSK